MAIITGTPGDDTGPNALTGTRDNDVISGLAGNDRLNGLPGDDRLNGGPGNDEMTGAAGSDIFEFNYTFTAGQTHSFIYDANGDQIADAPPSANAANRAWQNYETAVDAWYANLVQEHGADLNPSEVTARNNNGYTITYDNTYAYRDPDLVSAEGSDTITDFTANDTILIHGVMRDQFLAGVTTTVTDTNGDTVGDTVLSFNGGGGGLTLLGVQFASTQALVDSGGLIFA